MGGGVGMGGDTWDTVTPGKHRWEGGVGMGGDTWDTVTPGKHRWGGGYCDCDPR